LLEYDDVMNSQREVIYSKRRNALFGDKLSLDLNNQIYAFSQSLATEFQGSQDFEGLRMELIRLLAVDLPLTEEKFKSMKLQELEEFLFDFLISAYEHHTQSIASQAAPVFKDIFQT